MAADPYSLFVALDAAGAAEGDLYLDDGHSFNHKRGMFRSRQFRFSAGALTSTSASAVAGGGISAGVDVSSADRVVGYVADGIVAGRLINVGARDRGAMAGGCDRSAVVRGIVGLLFCINE